MTSVVEPLDWGINFSLKKYLKQKFTDFILSNDNIVKESVMDERKRIIKDILDVWKGKDKIIKNISQNISS